MMLGETMLGRMKPAALRSVRILVCAFLLAGSASVAGAQNQAARVVVPDAPQGGAFVDGCYRADYSLPAFPRRFWPIGSSRSHATSWSRSPAPGSESFAMPPGPSQNARSS